MQHIIANAQAIFRYTEGLDFLQFEEDRKTYDAVERCLQRITEAVIRLGDQAPALMPDQPWQRIRGFGNRLRHDYDSIEEDRLFDLVKTDLPSLYTAAEGAAEINFR
ncbi:MAG: DUF86 domain-containing protein [Acidobacteriota bacterium]|nr:DUF86 domain-containing protein [Acidobacteriota bacterium]